MELLKMKSTTTLIVILALFDGVFGDVKAEGASKVLYLMTSDIESDLPSNEPSVVTFTFGSDIPSNLVFSITSDIASNVTPDGSLNVTSHVTSNISLAIASDMPSRATFTMTSDVPSNVTMNITSDVPFNVTSNVPFSETMAATSELPSSETFEALAVKSTETSFSTKDNSNAILKMLFDEPSNITSFIHLHPKPSLPSNAASDGPVSAISSSPSSLASDTLSTETATVMSETSTTAMLDGSLEAFDVTSTETPVTQYDSNRILNVTSDGSNFTPSIFFDLPSTTPSNAASDGPVDITTSLPFDLASDILSTETPAMSETPSTTMLDSSLEVLDVISTETSFTQENNNDVTDGPVNPTSSLPFNPASSIPASTASYGPVTSITSSPFSVPADSVFTQENSSDVTDGPVNTPSSSSFNLTSDPPSTETPSTTTLDESLVALDGTSTEPSFTPEYDSNLLVNMVPDEEFNLISSTLPDAVSTPSSGAASNESVNTASSSRFNISSRLSIDDPAISEPDSNTMSNDIPEEISIKYETTSPPENTTSSDSRIAAIHGGRTAYEGQFPFMVAIHSIELSNFYITRYSSCGGTIISERWVLTAAHCVENNPVQVLLVFGDIDKGNIYGAKYFGSGVAMYASSVIQHPKYTKRGLMYNDIALAQTPRTIPFGMGIQPITLATSEQNSKFRQFSGKIGTIVGWGAFSNWDDGARMLQWAKVPIQSNSQCARHWWFLSSAEICTKPFQGPETCVGDSGGPLLIQSLSTHKYIQVGIVSYGGWGCPSIRSGVFTRVSSFMDWISSVTDIKF